MRRTTAPILCVCAVALVAGGCAEPEAEPELPRPEVTTVLVDVADATPEQLEIAAQVVQARVRALDLAVGQVGWNDAAIEVTVPVADEQLVRAALAPQGVLEVRPVLAVLDPATAPSTTPPGQNEAAEPIVRLAADGTPYLLGPLAIGPASVQSATAVSSDGAGWTVELAVSEGAGGIDELNRTIEQCYRGAPSCPGLEGGRGRLALMLDRVVRSTVVVQQPRLERDQLRLGGDLDADAARVDAAVLDGGAADVEWTVRD